MEMLLTIEQAATRLQLHPETVRRQIKRGLMRAVKRGRVWRVPESALEEAAPTPATPPPVMVPAEAETIWREMSSGDAGREMSSGDAGRQNDALRTLFDAPDDVRAIITRRSAAAAAAYYATPEGGAELADWRATNDAVHDEAGDYFTDEEEAEWRAQSAQGAAR